MTTYTSKIVKKAHSIIDDVREQALNDGFLFLDELRRKKKVSIKVMYCVAEQLVAEGVLVKTSKTQHRYAVIGKPKPEPEVVCDVEFELEQESDPVSKKIETGRDFYSLYFINKYPEMSREDWLKVAELAE